MNRRDIAIRKQRNLTALVLGIGWIASCGEAFTDATLGGDAGQSGSVASSGQFAGSDASDASQGQAGSIGTAGATIPDGGHSGGSTAGAGGSGGASHPDAGLGGAGGKAGAGGAGGRAGAGGAAGRAGAGGAGGTMGMAGGGMGGSPDPCAASKAGCVQCCKDKYAGSLSKYIVGWYECACSDPCYPICSDNHCGPPSNPTFDCIVCVKNQMNSTMLCSSDVPKCNGDPACFAYSNCVFGCL